MKKIALILGGLLIASNAIAERPTAAEIPGYSYGSAELARAPFTLDDLEALKKTTLFTEEDEKWLRRSRAILEPHAEEILDTWYGFVGSQPHLLYYFHDRHGKPDANYLKRVRQRFIQWIYDTSDAQYDQAWLDYQYEIARRHHRIGKNRTDGASGPNHIPMSQMYALLYPVTATLGPFLERGGNPPAEVDAMHQAWFKAVLIQAILWSYPYTRPGDF